MEEYIPCPFCGEEDFDLIGLKIHFIHEWCEDFNNTPNEHDTEDRP